ncbi:distal tail protein Dit [Cytobacillus pseudoceanisediminis]|uniref:distal tail protein Dit n=1 Tax=Cytobacillus pseudoceanisediminis TaxID=3051614 RepID=UPI003CE783E4
MALNNGFTFDGVRKDYVMTIGKKRTYWAPIRRDFITVPNRPGALLKDTTTDVRTVEVDIEISAISAEELRKNSEDLADWLLTDDAKELIFDDEPDRVYFAVVDGSFSPSEIVSHGYGTITFVCPDPYKYGAEETEQWPILDTLKQDFAGKVAGSTVENPHIAVTNNGSSSAVNSSLRVPGDNSGVVESSTLYSALQALGGATYPATVGIDKGIGQHLFSFDLIAAIERQYGVIPVATQAEKVSWLKANIKKLTANWHGKGTNKMANPNGKADFVGKVAGSVTANPHLYSYSVISPSSLLVPNAAGWESQANISQASYDRIKTLDGQTTTGGQGSVSGSIGQQIFSFNLIEYIKRKYGYTPTTQWIKDNSQRVKLTWHGRGTGPSGNRANLNLWSGESNTWTASFASHTSGNISPLAYDSYSFQSRITNDGFLHFSVNAEASNGTIASTIETDFVELEVELKPGADKANVTMWNSSSNSWDSPSSSHSNKTITSINRSSTSANVRIDSNGFVHFLAYAEPSNGIAASTIETDYIELLIDVNLTYSPSFVNVEGTVDTPPTFTVTLKDPVTYLDIIGERDYMRIGRPVNIDELAVPERQLILHDTMSTMTGWGDAQSSDIDGGVVSGTMTSDGNKFVATSVGTGSQWHGPAKIKSLGQSLTDFHVSFQPILDNDELYKIGRIELYLLDANKKAVGKLAIKDISKGQGGNYAELRVGDTTVNNFLISDYGTNWNTWHNFNGLLELTKKGNKWSAYVCKFINGDRNNRTSRMFVEWEDKENQFTRSVAYVVVHIGTNGTSVPSRMSIQDLQVFKVNTATTGQIPYIGYTGDVFEFDHATSAIYLNGDFFMRKDFGSRFFNLRPGENSVVFNPSSAIESVKTTWRSRYK